MIRIIIIHTSNKLCSPTMQNIGFQQSPSKATHGSSVKNDGEILLMLDRIRGMLEPQTTIDAAVSELQKNDKQNAKILKVGKSTYLV